MNTHKNRLHQTASCSINPFQPPAFLQLHPDDGDRLREALVRRSPAELILTFSDELGVSISTRESEIGHFKAHGCRELVEKIKTAFVPRGEILVLVNSESGTRVTTAKLDDLLGPHIPYPNRPSILR